MIFRLCKRIAIGAALIAAPIVCVPAPAASGSPPHAPRTPPIAVRAVTRLGRVSRYAFVEQPTIARSRPSSSAKPVGRLQTVTFWGTSTVVLALADTAGPSRTSWTEIRLAQPPNNVTGWVPSSTLSPLHAVHTWLKVDRERLTATLIRDGQTVFSAPVGVGQPQWPTPAGQFFVEESITPTEAEGVYGVFAFGTSAHSGVLTEWPNEGQIGIHGTDEPQLIPGRISHGCVRFRNADILRLEQLMPVGTPVTIS